LNEYKKQRTNDEEMEGVVNQERNEEPTFYCVYNQLYRESELILCDGCDSEGAYHTSCLRLDQVLQGDFLCEDCAFTLHARYYRVHGLVNAVVAVAAAIPTHTSNEVSLSMVWLWCDTVCVRSSSTHHFDAPPFSVPFTLTAACQIAIKHIQSFLDHFTWNGNRYSTPQPDIYQEFCRWYQRRLPQLVSSLSENQFYQCIPSKFSLFPEYRIEDLLSVKGRNTHINYLLNME
jgi:hypothetical protein